MEKVGNCFVIKSFFYICLAECGSSIYKSAFITVPYSLVIVAIIFLIACISVFFVHDYNLGLVASKNGVVFHDVDESVFAFFISVSSGYGVSIKVDGCR